MLHFSVKRAIYTVILSVCLFMFVILITLVIFFPN